MQGLIIAMHTCGKSLTQPAPKVSSKIIPIDSSSFTMFLFVSFIILCNPKFHALYLSIQILPSRSPGNHLSFVDSVQEITVISRILPKSACCLLSGAIRIPLCCKRLKSYGNTNTAWFKCVGADTASVTNLATLSRDLATFQTPLAT